MYEQRVSHEIKEGIGNIISLFDGSFVTPTAVAEVRPEDCVNNYWMLWFTTATVITEVVTTTVKAFYASSECAADRQTCELNLSTKTQ